jgi:uncharacterized protein
MQPRFDGQPLIDAYGDMGFRLASQRFEGSIILTPQGLYPWNVSALSEATIESLAPVTGHAGTFDFLLIGSGTEFARFPRNLTTFLTGKRIVPDFMDTGAACRTYNVLLAEDRRVAAALIAVT